MGTSTEKRRRTPELHPPPQPQFDRFFDSIRSHLEARIPKVKDEVEQALHFEEEAQDDAIADRLWAARSEQAAAKSAQVEAAETEGPGAAGPVEDATKEQAETAEEEKAETAEEKKTEIAEEKKTETAEEKKTETAEERRTETAEEKTSKPPTLSVRVRVDDGESFWDKEQWIEAVTPTEEEVRTIFAPNGKSRPKSPMAANSRPKSPMAAKMSMDAFLKEPRAPGGEVKNAAVQKALEEPADEPAMEEQAEGRSWQQGQPELKNLEGHEQQVVPAGAWSDMGIKLQN